MRASEGTVKNTAMERGRERERTTSAGAARREREKARTWPGTSWMQMEPHTTPQSHGKPRRYSSRTLQGTWSIVADAPTVRGEPWPGPCSKRSKKPPLTGTTARASASASATSDRLGPRPAPPRLPSNNRPGAPGAAEAARPGRAASPAGQQAVGRRGAGVRTLGLRAAVDAGAAWRP